jgi:hypothetical protein
MKKKIIIPVAVVAGAVAASVIQKRRKKKNSGYRSSNVGTSSVSSSQPDRFASKHSRRSARRSRAGE